MHVVVDERRTAHDTIPDTGQRRTAPCSTSDAAADPAGHPASAPRRRVTALPDSGMATAEYAVATLAAVGFAGLLLTVVRSPDVQQMLLDLIQRALEVAG